MPARSDGQLGVVPAFPTLRKWVICARNAHLAQVPAAAHINHVQRRFKADAARVRRAYRHTVENYMLNIHSMMCFMGQELCNSHIPRLLM